MGVNVMKKQSELISEINMYDKCIRRANEIIVVAIQCKDKYTYDIAYKRKEELIILRDDALRELEKEINNPRMFKVVTHFVTEMIHVRNRNVARGGRKWRINYVENTLKSR